MKHRLLAILLSAVMLVSWQGNAFAVEAVDGTAAAQKDAAEESLETAFESETFVSQADGPAENETEAKAKADESNPESTDNTETTETAESTENADKTEDGEKVEEVVEENLGDLSVETEPDENDRYVEIGKDDPSLVKGLNISVDNTVYPVKEVGGSNVIAAGITYNIKAIASPTYTGGSAGNVTDDTVVVTDVDWSIDEGKTSTLAGNKLKAGTAGETLTLTAKKMVKDKAGKDVELTSSIALKVEALPDETPQTAITWSEFTKSIDDVVLPDDWKWVEAGSAYEDGTTYTAVYGKADFYPKEAEVTVYGIDSFNAAISMTGCNPNADVTCYYAMAGNTVTVTTGQANFSYTGGKDYDIYSFLGSNNLPEELCKLKEVKSSVGTLTGSITGNKTYSGNITPSADFTITASYELSCAVYDTAGVPTSTNVLKTKAFSTAKTSDMPVVIVEKMPVKTITLDEGTLASGWTWTSPSLDYEITTAQKREDLGKEQKLSLVMTLTDAGENLVTGANIPDLNITYKGEGIVSAAQNKEDKTKIDITIPAGSKGHATVVLSPNDKGGYSKEFNINIRDYEPKLESTLKPKLRKYHQNSSVGALNLLVPYEYKGNESSLSAAVMKSDGTTPAPGMAASVVGENYNYGKYATFGINVRISDSDLITDDMKGTKPYKIVVKSKYEDKAFDVKINIDFTKVKVTCKQTNKVNTFYLDTSQEVGTYDPAAMGLITFKPNMSRIIDYEWIPNAGVENKKLDFAGYDTNIYKIYQKGLEKKKDNVSDSDKTGTLKLTLAGVKEQYVIQNFKIKTVYKKPKLSVPVYKLVKGGSDWNRISTNAYASYKKILNVNNYKILYKDGTTYVGRDYTSLAMKTAVDGITVTDDTSSYGYNSTTISYTGDKRSLTVPITVISKYWAEDLDVNAKVKVVTIKTATVSPVLVPSTVTLNIKYPAEEYKTGEAPDLRNKKNGRSIECKKFVITGKDSKSQKLLDDDIINIEHEGNYSDFKVSLSSATAMKMTVANGTYKFKVVPYMNDGSTDGVELKAQTLTVKITDKDAGVDIKKSGKIDLVKFEHMYNYYGGSSHNYGTKNAVKIKPSFVGRNSASIISDVKIVGEHFDDFRYYATTGKYIRYDEWNYNGEVYIVPKLNNKLIAGQKYTLRLEYTLIDYAGTQGKSIVLYTKPFDITPTQSVPKVKVSPGSVTLDIKEDYGALATLVVPKGYIIGNGAQGGIDIDKDGVNDIRVRHRGSWSYVNESVTIEIVNKNVIKVLKNGTKLKVPVTMPLRGRDGTTKDPTATITVTIKNK